MVDVLDVIPEMSRRELESATANEATNVALGFGDAFSL